MPFGLGIRAKRICWEDTDYQVHRGQISKLLQRRGYITERVDDQLKLVDALDRDHLQQHRRRENKSEGVTLVEAYKAVHPNIHAILRKHMTMLHKAENLQAVPLASYTSHPPEKTYLRVLRPGKT